jgi:hypothetical protein
MNSLEAAFPGKDTTTQADLHVSFELGDRSWKLSCGGGTHSPSRCSVTAGDKRSHADFCLGSGTADGWARPRRAACTLAADVRNL